MSQYIENGMLLEPAPQWSLDKYGVDVKGLGDACWRTSIYYICTGEKWAKDSVVEMLTKRIRYFGDKPTPEYGSPHAFTRDQLIMGLVSLYLNGDDEFYTIPIPFKLSDSARLTAALDAWIKFMRYGESKYFYRYERWMVAEMYMMNLKDSLLKKTLLRKYNITMSDHIDDVKSHVWGPEWSSYAKLSRLLYPSFAVHLNSWLNYCIQPNDEVKIQLLKHVPKANVVIHELNRLSNKPKVGIYGFEPRLGYPWQSRIENPTTYPVADRDNGGGINISYLVLEYLGLLVP